jgi:hypothetical protein
VTIKMLHRLTRTSNSAPLSPLKWSALRLTSPVLVSLVALVSGCGSSSGPDGAATGGVSATGGATGTGGASTNGGATTGGLAATGGSSALGGSGGIATGGAATGGVVSTGGAATGGAVSTGGAGGGAVSTGGAGGGAVSTGGAGGGAVSTGGAAAGGSSGAKFSFFVTSQAAIVAVSKSDNGFGGDLTFGETGAGAGLRGADKICAAIADRGMAGAGQKTWRAFLSATDDGTGKQVNAIDRVGAGPWYDRKGRLFAMTKADLLTERPTGADPQIINDFPNEDGVPNHAPDGMMQVDNHDILTGTNDKGELYSMTATCKDWTSSDGATGGKPRVGHAWPRATGGGGGKAGGGGGMNNWMSALDEAGCGKGFNIVEMGGPNPSVTTVGSGGGYGAIYCFALTP